MGVAFTAKIKRFMESRKRKQDESISELEARAERFARDVTAGIIVRLRQAPSTTIQLPRELALALLQKRGATIVGSLDIIPDLILTDEDFADDSELEAELWRSIAP